MRNRDIYAKDPSQQRLVNEGVATVNDDTSDRAQKVLRYELETFVCEGQYASGLTDILDAFLRNIGKDSKGSDNAEGQQQPAVWISGFFGSGKSHLAKILRALWENVQFGDGATARGITTLPQAIQDHLKELTTAGRRNGGLFAAAGTLGASSTDKSVRLALLAIIFQAAGLPRQYPVARFVMWLRDEGILETVRDDVIARGDDWQEELDNFYVAESLHESLVKTKPNLFNSVDACAQTLAQLYPNVNDVSSEEMLKAIRQAVSQDGNLPLILIVIDEVQQYIGMDGQRSIAVQEAVEACSKGLGSRMMFVGTGQTAITGTANLARLQGRFTVRVELSDADVDAVIRQVILAKKPEARQPIADIMEKNLGEISRHLSATTIGHHQNDIDHFAQDYPILPVRRRFWDKALRVLDQTGTDSQLRNQLSMIHKAIQTNLDEPLGTVIPGDYLYFDATEKLLQARVLPRKLHDATQLWLQGSPDEQLIARACALVFLINKVIATNQEIGLHASLDTIADLMVVDLDAGSGSLRSSLPKLLDNCEFIIQVGEEYRIQTEESAAWNDAFQSERGRLASSAQHVETDRDDRIRQHFSNRVGNLTITHGASLVPRHISPSFDTVLPTDANERIYAWIRHGWLSDESQVQADARQAGSDSPTLFVFIPRRSADDIRNRIMDAKAAATTLDTRGVPTTPEGLEARSAMRTTKDAAERRIEELLDDAFRGAHVYQGGGHELVGNDLKEMITEGAQNALTRLYPRFEQADNPNWDKVYAKAKQGAPDALEKVGADTEPQKHPVCKAILSYIGNGKKGADIRVHFEGGEFGWPRDAVNGAIQVLLVAGQIRTADGTPPQALENKAIGQTEFRVESTTISTSEEIKIRKLFQHLGITAKSGEVSAKAPEFVNELTQLAESAGGEPPRPASPQSDALEAIRTSSGNEQLKNILNNKDELIQSIDRWRARESKIEARLPGWRTLQSLAGYAQSLEDGPALRAQVEHIRDNRQLVDDPDPIKPLIDRFTQHFRDRFNALDASYTDQHQAGMERLAANHNWEQLAPEQRHDLLEAQRLTAQDKPTFKLASTDEILKTLDQVRPDAFADRITALPSLFDTAAVEAARLLEPKVQRVSLPARTLKTEADIDTWLAEARKALSDALHNGPVVTR
jgi:hypothetical protein